MNSAQLTFLGHASFKLTLADGRVILIDPWLQDNPACPAAEKTQSRCDIIALTHAHADHCADVPALVKQHKPHVVAIYELANLLATRAPEAEYVGMSIGGTVDVQGVQFSMTRAFHSSGYQEGDDILYAGMPAGFVVTAPGLAKVYHAGDTDVFSDMQFIQQLHSPEIVLLPIGDHFTMGPRAAAIAARFFTPQAIVPIHHGTFPLLTGTPEALRAELGAPLADRVMVLAPGQSAMWTATGLGPD